MLVLTIILTNLTFSKVEAFHEALNGEEEIISEGKVDDNSLIDISSITINKSEVVSGDTVKLSFKVNEDISKISGVTTIYNKGTTGAWKWMSMEYNSDTGCFEGYKSIGDYTEEGTWTIDQIHLEYIDGTEKYLQNINDIDYEEGEDFSGGNFIVTGTDSDLKPPVLDVDSLTLSSKKAVAGDRLLLTVKASDDKSGIDSICIIYREPDYKSLSLTYNQEKDVYEGYIDIDENTTLGEWKISQVYLEDKEENYIYINNGISETENNVKDLSAGNFTVLESYENPVINGVEEVILKVGDTFDPMDGVTAFDCQGRELTSDIIVTGNVKTWLIGKYSLTYTVTDIYGVTTTETRIVRVTLGVKDINGDGKIDISEFLKWLFGIS